MANISVYHPQKCVSLVKHHINSCLSKLVTLTWAMSSKQLKMYFRASFDFMPVSNSCSSGVYKIWIFKKLNIIFTFLFKSEARNQRVYTAALSTQMAKTAAAWTSYSGGKDVTSLGASFQRCWNRCGSSNTAQRWRRSGGRDATISFTLFGHGHQTLIQAQRPSIGRLIDSLHGRRSMLRIKNRPLLQENP